MCDHCLSSNNRLSVPISGGRGPGDLASVRDWLARHCEKFTLEGAVCWIFSLPIKCGMQLSRRPFKVCCACMCVSVCLSPYPPLSFPHRGLSVETRQPREQVRWDLKPARLFFHAVPHVSLIPSAFAVVTLRGSEEATNTTANYFLQYQSLLIRRGITLSANVCVCSL